MLNESALIGGYLNTPVYSNINKNKIEQTVSTPIRKFSDSEQNYNKLENKPCVESNLTTCLNDSGFKNSTDISVEKFASSHLLSPSNQNKIINEIFNTSEQDNRIK